MSGRWILHKHGKIYLVICERENKAILPVSRAELV
jgi:hypothetical protein